MRIFLLILAGVAGGVIGGMGLGGGTLLIPILVFGLKVPARLAAWVNLIVFLPMGVVALIAHGKRGLVDWRAAGRLLVFASIGTFLSLTFVKRVSQGALGKAFGVFLIVLGGVSIFLALIGYIKQKSKR